MNLISSDERESHTESGTAGQQDAATWMCVLCAWIYDEAQGDPAGGVPPGTRWEDVPDTWICPDCGVGKNEFVMVQV